MADSVDLLDIPDFLKREAPVGPTRRARRTKRQDMDFRPGVVEKRPTRGQYATLAKRGWSASQVVKLGRDEAGTIIKLGVGPEARFMKKDKRDDA